MKNTMQPRTRYAVGGPNYGKLTGVLEQMSNRDLGVQRTRMQSLTLYHRQRGELRLSEGYEYALNNIESEYARRATEGRG